MTLINLQNFFFTIFQAVTVKDNIAILLADSNAEQPVRGLRMAAMAADGAFSDDGFEFISGLCNFITIFALVARQGATGEKRHAYVTSLLVGALCTKIKYRIENQKMPQ